MKSRRSPFFVGAIAATLIAASAFAAITTPVQNFTINPQGTVVIPLKLQTTAGESIAAFSGQLNFTPGIFYGPKIAIGSGASGFATVGFEYAPGKFRFVVYKDPSTPIPVNTGNPTVNITLSNTGNLAYFGREDMTFSNGPLSASNPDRPGQSSASTLLGASLPNVAFGAVHIKINQTSAEDWMLYQ